MKFFLCGIIFLLILCCSHPGQCGEVLTRDLLKSLPETSKRDLVPFLEVEWSTLPVDQFGLLIQFQTRRWKTPFFNPFGNAFIGCPYQVVLTDTDWNPVFQVMKVESANLAIPPPSAWIIADNNRIIGRRFWRNRDWTLTSKHLEFSPDPVSLSEGSYLLHLLMTARLETEPPFNDNPIGNARDQALWRTDELDRFVCRSKPVPIQVGADGRVRRPVSEPLELEHKSPIRITTTIDKQELTVQARLITDKEYQCTNPGLRGISVDAGIHVKSPVGVYLDHTLMGKSDEPGFAGYRSVPKDAILGLRRRYPGQLEPGSYEISVAFPSNLWLDRDVDPSVSKKTTQLTISQKQILK